MQKIFLFIFFFIFIFSGASWAQELDEDSVGTSSLKTKQVEHWAVGLGMTQWNEEMRIAQGGVTVGSTANFSGMLVSIQKEFTRYRWGWNFGGLVGSGYANGGSDSGSANSYLKTKVSYSLLGASTRIFYRFSGRINFGTSFMIFNRIIEWPSEGSIQASSGKNPNILPVIDLNVRVFNTWELYQGIGPVANGATFWKIGMNYRF